MYICIYIYICIYGTMKKRPLKIRDRWLHADDARLHRSSAAATSRQRTARGAMPSKGITPQTSRETPVPKWMAVAPTSASPFITYMWRSNLRMYVYMVVHKYVFTCVGSSHTCAYMRQVSNIHMFRTVSAIVAVAVDCCNYMWMHQHAYVCIPENKLAKT